MLKRNWKHSLAATTCLCILSACQTTPSRPLPLAKQVDLPRFMGGWYVIAAIPTMFEKGAHNPMDHYVLEPDGSITTTYTFNADSFDGKAKSYQSRGYVLDPSNAIWGQQYVWPFKADYRISYVSPDYSQTIVAREKRDYVWIMARTPSIPDADYQLLVKMVGEQGYDVSLLQKALQRAPQK
ncbi:lipocalin family protein [Uliginosibacterium sp. H3]|uniref:Outer membrane lipoprotein Blc n=1 Tax=Uliginosibacterium silvisoli TaxID=3114758 RepID=A0ABU6K8P4_9RHOO|nr:lipocalin family protein [Uliginosibacterium sp. H3]